MIFPAIIMGFFSLRAEAVVKNLDLKSLAPPPLSADERESGERRGYGLSRVVVGGVRLMKIEKGTLAIYVPEFQAFSPELLSHGVCAPKIGRKNNEVSVARVEASITETMVAYADAVQETMSVMCDSKKRPQAR
jgi:hypothetical protein